MAKPAPKDAESPPNSIVVLIPGIRDHAIWVDTLRKVLLEENFDVEAVNYGRFGPISFLSPIPWEIARAEGEVEEQLADILEAAPDGAQVHVIAHSFGSYLLTQILKRRGDIRFTRVVFCGSVVHRRTNFTKLGLGSDLLNEVGEIDQWPALAESSTWRYGAAGTVGLRKAMVRDRWNKGVGHPDYLKPEFCRTKWVPFLRTGTVVDEKIGSRKPAWWVTLLLIFPLKYVLPLLVLAFFVVTPLPGLQLCRMPWCTASPPTGQFVYYEPGPAGLLPQEGRLLDSSGGMGPIESLAVGQVLRAGDSIHVRNQPTTVGSTVISIVSEGQCVRLTGPGAAKIGAVAGWLPIEPAKCPLAEKPDEPKDQLQNDVGALIDGVRLGAPRSSVVAILGEPKFRTKPVPQAQDEIDEADDALYRDAALKTDLKAEFYALDTLLLEVLYLGDSVVRYGVVLRGPGAIKLSAFPDLQWMATGAVEPPPLGAAYFSDFWSLGCTKLDGVSSSADAWFTATCDGSKFTNYVSLVVGTQLGGAELPSAGTELYAEDKGLESYPDNLGFGLLFQVDEVTVECDSYTSKGLETRKDAEAAFPPLSWRNGGLDTVNTPLLCFSMRMTKPNAFIVTDLDVAYDAVTLPSGKTIQLEPSVLAEGVLSDLTLGAKRLPYFGY